MRHGEAGTAQSQNTLPTLTEDEKKKKEPRSSFFFRASASLIQLFQLSGLATVEVLRSTLPILLLFSGTQLKKREDSILLRVDRVEVEFTFFFLFAAFFEFLKIRKLNFFFGLENSQRVKSSQARPRLDSRRARARLNQLTNLINF